MGIPIDADIFFLLAAVGSVLGSLPRLRSLPTSRIPVRYEIQEVLQDALTEAQAKFLAPYDEKLGSMNYLPLCTYRVLNYGHNLLRNYVSPMDTARCVVMIYEIPVENGGKSYSTSGCTIHFHTRFTNGTILTTRNMPVKSITDQPPYEVVQERPGLTDPAQMKREHDRKAATMGQPVFPPADAKSILDDVQSEHQRFCEYQVAKGSYSLLADENCYILTDQVLQRAVWNHLNPLAQNLSMRRFLPAALVAIGLPLLAMAILAPAAAQAAVHGGFPPFIAGRLVVIASYVVAGAVLGYLLEHNKFLWALLLTYLALRVSMILPIGAPPFGTFAAAVAYSVARAKKRHNAGLLQSGEPASAPNPLSSARSA